MLVLSRRQTERIAISVNGVRISVTVLEWDRGKVRLGFEAPLEVAIYRQEVQDAIDAGSTESLDGHV